MSEPIAARTAAGADVLDVMLGLIASGISR